MNRATTPPAKTPDWCLRFLTGAERGRTIALAAGTNVLGSAGDCQVLLPSSDVQPHHLAFNVGSVAVSVQRMSPGEVRVNGEELKEARRSLVVGDVVAVGSIEFQIERHYAQDHAQDGFGDSMFAGAEGTPLALGASADGVQRNRPGMWALAGTVWILTMLLGVWAFWAHTTVPPASEQVNLQALESALKDFAEIEVVAGTSGRVNIKGFVESQARKLALQRATQPFGSRVSVNVHAVDDLIDQARRFVSDPGVAIAYAGKGRLVVSGKSENPEVQARIRRLGDDLHPIVFVSDKVQYRARADDAGAEARDQWTAWQRALPSRMVSITEDGAGMRYIQLANGSLYFEGSVLKSGVELNTLRPDANAPPHAAP